MFVLLITYVKPLDEIDQLREGHMAYLDKYYRAGKFIVSGGKKPRTGGVILANVESEAEARAIIQDDPFLSEGAARYDVIEFLPTNYDPRFAPFVETERTS